MNSDNSMFKTPDAAKQYLELYQSVLAMWKVPFEPMDIKSSFGITHINVSGPRESPSLVLLPGFGANSTMWFPNISALSSKFRVYSVDTNGQPGKSLTTKKLMASNSTKWIAEVMDGLDLEKANLAGVSLGGWLALNFAIKEPTRVEKLVLLDPAASFKKMSGTFLWHSFWPIMVHPTRQGLLKYFRWMTRGYQVNEQWGEMMLLGILNTHPQPPIRATPFGDDELRSMQMPVMVLIGERSVIYDPQRACERAQKLIPGVKAEIIPGASHALNAEKAELVNKRILQFLL